MKNIHIDHSRFSMIYSPAPAYFAGMFPRTTKTCKTGLDVFTQRSKYQKTQKYTKDINIKGLSHYMKGMLSKLTTRGQIIEKFP